MDISTLIETKYPINLYLANNNQSRDISLTFDQSISTASQDRLLDMLTDMSIDVRSRNYFGSITHILVSAANNILTLTCSGDISLTVTLEGEDLCSTAAWCIYLIASSSKLLTGRQQATIRTHTFSLEQQLMARSLQKAVQHHRFGKVTQKEHQMLTNLFSDCLKKLASDLASDAPSVSHLPIPASGLDNSQQLYLSRRSYNDLLQNLQCSTALSDQLDAFCKMTPIRPEYKEKINSYVALFLENVRFLPMSDIGNVIAAVKPDVERNNRENYDNIADAFEKKLTELCSPGRMTADNFTNIFAPLDNAMRVLTAARIQALLTEDFFQTLMARYEQLKHQAGKDLMQLQKVRLCLVDNEQLPPLRLDWQNLSNISSEVFSVPPCTWSHNNGSMVASIVQGGFKRPVHYSCTWLCTHDVYNIISNLPAPAEIIPGMNPQLLVAFLIK